MVAVLSAMKMEMAVQAPMGGKVIRCQISEIEFDQIWNSGDSRIRIRISCVCFSHERQNIFMRR